MYKNGLHFPIFNVLINDNLIITKLDNIINKKTPLVNVSEEKFNSAIVEFINKEKGYEIYPFLLNNFDHFLQSHFKFNKNVITSKFIKVEEFIMLFRSFKVDFLKIDKWLFELEKICLIDRSGFYSELYKLLYRSYAIKLGAIVNFSDFEASELFLDFILDLKKFEEYQKELGTTKPNIIRDYDFKKKYVQSFYDSFIPNSLADMENKIKIVKSHTDREILKTFKKLVKTTIILNQDINEKTRNKVFKPIFKEINAAISGKAYSENTKNALTKEVKRFFSYT